MILNLFTSHNILFCRNNVYICRFKSRQKKTDNVLKKLVFLNTLYMHTLTLKRTLHAYGRLLLFNKYYLKKHKFDYNNNISS
jgi:hypothetical protein